MEAVNASDFELRCEDVPARRALDKYRTPDWVTASLLEYFPEVDGDVLIDPCAGDSRMVQQILDAGRFKHALTNDLDQAESSVETHDDAGSAAYWWSPNIKSAVMRCHLKSTEAWVVTNPPFSAASKIVYEALQAVPNVAMLLRGTWLEPARDRLWLGRMPPTALLVMPRFSFTGGGSDQTGCHWMIWGNVAPGIKVCTKKPGQLSLFGVADE